ncbi:MULTISPECIES: dihydrofolate reductase family protein [unclassified Arthrobacter]|jgi:dihydrofolate reductase|uniref:dihydrofolate reductase family protein n=1 Tax=unclassified Arthrobacter TaxID=235627 RepID=UPI001C856D7E|nr:dihydrofolate reductase family protein [Arthrobacter sp. MAHUQ-56]MBX7443015.1 dihydrofolate reductase family protein [Arthrobacter sp. MAHUQ-56]
MRKVTAGLFHSVDGVVSDPFKFQFDSFDEELGQGLATMINTVDTVVLGRVSYQEWAGYWPTAATDEDFARFINPVEKFVASRTLTAPLEWQNSQLMDAPLEEFVSRLKERDGGEIAVCGSISVVRQLLFAGLLDSLTLMTHPVIAGSGRHLFGEGDPLTRLVLQEQSRTSKGNVLTTYGLRGE